MNSVEFFPNFEVGMYFRYTYTQLPCNLQLVGEGYDSYKIQTTPTNSSNVSNRAKKQANASAIREER